MQNTSFTFRNMGFGLVALGVLAACDSASDNVVTKGIASLGNDFVRAFNQDPNDTPIALGDVQLAQTPLIEPFNP